MKSRMWVSGNKKVRVLERVHKTTETRLFDVQVKRNHIWCPYDTNLSAEQVEKKYKIDTGSHDEAIKSAVEQGNE
jgi:hypothetical protein